MHKSGAGYAKTASSLTTTTAVARRPASSSRSTTLHSDSVLAAIFVPSNATPTQQLRRKSLQEVAHYGSPLPSRRNRLPNTDVRVIGSLVPLLTRLVSGQLPTELDRHVIGDSTLLWWLWFVMVATTNLRSFHSLF
jgi:hypothetical protein